MRTRPSGHPSAAPGREPPRDPLRSPRPLRRASRPAGSLGAWARPAAPRPAARAARARAPRAPAASSSTTSSRHGPRRSLEAELGAPPSALVVVFSSPTLRAGTPGLRGARPPRRCADVADGATRRPGRLARCSSRARSSADGHTAYDIVFLDLPPDDSPDALPILAERLRPHPGSTVELAGGPAFYGDVQTVSEARPAAERAHLAAAGGARAAPRLRVARRGGRAARRRRRGGPRRPGRHLPRRVGDADEHLRAQPRDAPRARASASTTRCS